MIICDASGSRGSLYHGYIGVKNVIVLSLGYIRCYGALLNDVFFGMALVV